MRKKITISIGTKELLDLIRSHVAKSFSAPDVQMIELVDGDECIISTFGHNEEILVSWYEDEK